MQVIIPRPLFHCGQETIVIEFPQERTWRWLYENLRASSEPNTQSLVPAANPRKFSAYDRSCDTVGSS